MRLTCPACGAMHSLDALLNDMHAREAVAAALSLPAPLGDRILRYLALFRPAQRALSWDRAAKLLQELLIPIKAGQVERHGRAWPAPLVAWQTALDQMLAGRDKLQLPLKSHGYLFEIVASLANKGEAQAEAKHEAARKQRPATPTPRIEQPPHAPGQTPAGTQSGLKQMRQVLKSLKGGARDAGT